MIQTQKRSTKKQLQCALKVHTPATTFVDEVFQQESLQQRLGIRFEKTAINKNITGQTIPTKPPTRGGLCRTINAIWPLKNRLQEDLHVFATVPHYVAYELF